MAQIDRIKRKIGVGLLAAIFAVGAVLPAFAQALPPIISDDETETFIHNVVRPLFSAADISFNPNKIYLINDNSLNAFVTVGNYLFVHTGTLLGADNVNQLSGVLAHESGHISGGHVVRQQLKMRDLSKLMVASLIAAGATAVASGRGDAAMAVLMGSQSSALTNMLHYQLQEERSADESAVKVLQKTGQSPAGLRDFMKKIQYANRLSGYAEDPYFRTHPLSRERQNFFERAVAENRGVETSPYDEKFKMVKAKLAGFLLPVQRGWALYPETDKSTAARYAHAILHYRQGHLPQSLKELDGLIAAAPDNPYFYELKGQFLYENGRLDEALQAYNQALKFRPSSAEIKLGWAQAALEAPHTKADLQKIINTLNQIQIKRPDISAWMLLSRAYAEDGQQAAALYAAAQYSCGLGNVEAAKRQIEQAEQQNPPAELRLKLADLKRHLQEKN